MASLSPDDGSLSGQSRKERRRQMNEERKLNMQNDILESMYGVGMYAKRDKASRNRGNKGSTKLKHRKQHTKSNSYEKNVHGETQKKEKKELNPQSSLSVSANNRFAAFFNMGSGSDDEEDEKDEKAEEKNSQDQGEETKSSSKTEERLPMIEECEGFLLGECTNENCPKWHNFAKLNAADNNEILQRRVRQMHKLITAATACDMEMVVSEGLDMMFIMDCTFSMGSWLRAATEEINAIIDKIITTHRGVNIRVAFVGYQDHPTKNRFFIYPFTQNVSSVRKYISERTVGPGTDFPEDVAGALNQALKQDWRQSSRYAVLVTDAPCHGKKYHGLSDNYPSGDPTGLHIEKLVAQFAEKKIALSAIKITRYTDIMFDIFQKVYKKVSGTPIIMADLGSGSNSYGSGKSGQNGQFRDFVASSASSTLTNGSLRSRGGSGMSYLSLTKKLSESCQGDEDLMQCLREMKMSTEDSFTFGDGSVRSGAGSFSRSRQIKQEQSSVVSGNKFDIIEEDEEDEEDSDEDSEQSEEKRLRKEEEERKKKEKELAQSRTKVLNFKIVTDPPQWNSFGTQIQEAVCHSWYIKQSRNQEIDWKNPDISQTQVDTKVQISKFPFSQGALRFAFYMKDLGVSGDHQKTVAKFPKKITKKYTVETMRKEIEAVLMCQLITNEFNDRLVNNANEGLLMSFVQPYVYEVVGGNSKWKLFSAETYLKGDYQKYNNNAGWEKNSVSPKVLIAQALSHFSWQFTKGYMMITDLQGVGSFLTDPQIHCLDRGRFGGGDLGYVGMLRFFATHKCNKYCNELSLVHPKTKDSVDKNLIFFGQILQNPNDKLFGIIKKLCEICGKPFEIPHKLYYQKRIHQESFNCRKCEAMKTRSVINKECKTCQEPFSCSQFVYSLRRRPLPELCKSHRSDE